MLVFVDESGDTGLKFGKGSSDYRKIIKHREISVRIIPE